MSRNIKVNEWAVAEDVLRLREQVAKLERENARLQMELDASCNAEELRQVRAENTALRAALKEIAARGPHDGSCGYGCDSPGIAISAIDAARKEAQP